LRPHFTSASREYRAETGEAIYQKVEIEQMKSCSRLLAFPQEKSKPQLQNAYSNI